MKLNNGLTLATQLHQIKKKKQMTKTQIQPQGCLRNEYCHSKLHKPFYLNEIASDVVCEAKQTK